MRLVLVEWQDSYGCSANWQTLEGVECAPLTCRSVGWLFKDGDDFKVIIPHLSDPDHPSISQQGCGDMAIPTRAIVRIVDLPIPN